MRKAIIILLTTIFCCAACQWKFGLNDPDEPDYLVKLERYDRVESQYLTTSDFAALQQLNTEFPTQTRTLIEDVLKLGRVNDPEINVKFLNFFQDTTLQTLITSVEQQFADVKDLNEDLSATFGKLQELIPSITIPKIYTQIGALDQSIIIGNGEIGICLDKYLGEDYPLYTSFYNEQQRKMMTREMIVPDCVVFYLVSQYPMPDDSNVSQMDHDIFMARILWVANKALRRNAFKTTYIDIIEAYMRKKNTTCDKLLSNHNYAKIVKESGKTYHP